MRHNFFHDIVSVGAVRGLLGASLLLLGSASVWAHGTLIRADPAVNAQVAERPSEIRLWFNESIEYRFSRVTVHRAKRDAATGTLKPLQRVDEGLAAASGVTLELAVKLPAVLAPGLYLVEWTVLSIDSHRTTGKFTLTYAPQTDKANPTR